MTLTVGLVCGFLLAAPTALAGDPIPGVDISLEQVPGGQTCASTDVCTDPVSVGEACERAARAAPARASCKAVHQHAGTPGCGTLAGGAAKPCRAQAWEVAAMCTGVVDAGSVRVNVDRAVAGRDGVTLSWGAFRDCL